MYYQIQFIGIWIFAILIIPLSIITFILSFERNQIYFLGITIWCVLCAIIIRLRASKIAIRAAAWPGMCRDITPRVCTPEELLRQIRPRMIVVGSGWGYFLQRLVDTSPKLYMHCFTGKMPGSEERWAAGTTIKTMADIFKKSGLTFPSTPSNQDITIGAWFAMGNHGSGGDIGRPSSSVLADATIIDIRRREIMRNVSGARVRRLFDTSPSRYIIVDVRFKDLEPDILIQKRLVEIDLRVREFGIRQCEEWLETGAYLRMCFLGAARQQAFGLRWEKIYSNTTHLDPHCCSKICTLLQADVCSAVCGCHEDMSQWNGKTRLSDANEWVPPISEFSTLSVILLGLKNFEIVVQIDLDANLLWTLMKELKDMHDTYGGRSEIRYGTRYLFIDVVMARGFQRPFAILNDMGVEEIALHPGKWKPTPAFVHEVTLSDIYNIEPLDIQY